MSIIMMKDRLHSNNSLSSETVSLSVYVFFFAKKENLIHMHTDIQYITKMLFED